LAFESGNSTRIVVNDLALRSSKPDQEEREGSSSEGSDLPVGLHEPDGGHSRRGAGKIEGRSLLRDYEDSGHAAVVMTRRERRKNLNNAITLDSGTPITGMAMANGITDVRAQGGDSSGTACWAPTSTLQQSVTNVSRP